MNTGKTLLQKYEIPLNHLDFAYVEKCQNAREMEKIVKILRSGEEGFFPDLTRCAEEKLKELKPESKLFRFEEKIQGSDILGKQELEPIYNWTNDIKTKDNALAELKQEVQELKEGLPPMREPGKIDLDKEQSQTKKPEPTQPKTGGKPQVNDKRIKSTDYSKWDKYDPDEEILRMDLEDERAKEQIQVKSNKTEKSNTSDHLKISEPPADEQRLQGQLKSLSQLEREQYADKCRLRGNEYFKAKEYTNAIKEYTRTIIADPDQAARAYNNRSISYIKMQNYQAAIKDCEACLKLEPNNVKALLRLADSYYNQGNRRESHFVYQRVLDLEPNNASAKKSLEQLRLQLGELAPAHATRMIIEEQQSDKEKPAEVIKSNSSPQPKPEPVKPIKDYDLAELVKPNRLVKNKMLSAAEALGGQLKGNQLNDSAQKQQLPLPVMTREMPTVQPTELRLPLNSNANNNNKKKILIQEL